MKAIFRNKKISFLLVVLTMVLVLLVLCLLTNLSQITSLNAKLRELESLTSSIEGDISESRELLDYLQSNEYLIWWAIKEGLLTEDAYNWIQH